MSNPAVRITAAIVAAAALAGPMRARADEPAVSIATVRHDPEGKLAAQLAGALCSELRCVPGARVMDGGRIDFEAARRAGVAAILFGTVAGTAARPVLAVALLRGSLKPERNWFLPLDAERRLRSADVAALRRDLAAALDLAASKAPAPVDERAPDEPAKRSGPQRSEPAAASAAPAPPPAAVAPKVPPRTATGTDPAAPSRTPSQAASTPPAPKGPPGDDAWIAVDAGVSALGRAFDYRGVASSAGTLMQTTGGTIVAPVVRVEVRPWAARRGWLAAVAGFASYRRSVGYALAQADTKHSAVYSDAEAGLGARLLPLGGSRLEVMPTLSYRRLGLAVSGNPAGLASPSLTGPALGLDVTVPLGRTLALVGRASSTWWLGAGEVVSSAFFPRGSASALDASLGVSVAAWGPLSVRAIGEYGLTRYRSLAGSATYVATGASDRYVGGRAVVRWSR